MKTIRRDGSIDFADRQVEWIYQVSGGLVDPNDREILELTQARFRPNGAVMWYSNGELARVSYPSRPPIASSRRAVLKNAMSVEEAMGMRSDLSWF